MMQAHRKRLGRGLAALIGDDTGEAAEPGDVRSLRHVPIDLLHANPNNPRKHFADTDIDELAKSIGDKGLLQPLIVRPRPDGEFEIVAGERRWRAAQRAGVHEVPALVRELDDGQALEIALVENIQRSDLNPLDEALAFRQLLEQFGYTQQQLADSVGKSRSHIANTMRLLSLPESVRSQIEAGRLTAGHARALVATDSPAELAEQIIELGLSVRESEQLSRQRSAKPSMSRRDKDADTRALENSMSQLLGLAVRIRHGNSAGGTITIAYKSLDQLEEVCRRLQA